MKMNIINSVTSLRKLLENETTKSIGFVPTMGALHEGHLSLVRQSCSESDLTVVSIFVNPTQFNDPDDLKKYPRDLDRDSSLLTDILSQRDILFVPEYDDLYDRELEFNLDLEGLDLVMEGKHRPGHFEGVVRVVKLLFEAVKPHRAYFGQKDFQQLTIIKKMVEKLAMDTDIIACPILREPSGLAMSSRNERLPEKIRSMAGLIHSTLCKHNTIAPKDDIPAIEKNIISEIESSGYFRTEYIEIVDDVSLTRISTSEDIIPGRKYFACIAVYTGEIRLIDNIEISFQFIKG